MDNAMMIGLSRQMTLRRAMDVTANNIANASTTGFKAERLLLQANPATPARALDGPQRLNYVDEIGIGRDFSQGLLEPTGRPLDLAIEGEGFFVLDTEAGERFTRDGRFMMDPEGAITASDGSRVLDTVGQPIILDPQAGAIEVSASGEIAQNGAVVAQLGVVRFDAMSALQKTGDNRFAAGGAEPEPIFTPVVRQGFSEGSNVRAILEITRMLEVSRAYSSATRLVNNTDELSKKALERLGRP
ncbi:MAG: flagellar basal-body rod protein FlgF [Pseudomonadota bacterium]